MSAPRLRPLPKPPSGAHIATRGDDGAAEACRRLALLFKITLFGLALAAVVAPLARANEGVRAGLDRPYWLIPVTAAVCLLMLWVLGRQRWPAGRRLDLGLGGVVVVCGLYAYFAHALPYGPADVVRGPSGIAFAILVFATVVPVPPGRLVVVLPLTALTDPIALLVTIGAGNPAPHATLWLWLFIPTAACLGFAFMVSRQLYTLRSELRVAQRLGSYRLVEKLGEGGMGQVWRAEHHTLARPAAIKLIRLDRLAGASEQIDLARRRFEREARATALLESPHTIEVYDFGSADDGTVYYVMELLDGMDLKEAVERTGPLPAARVAHLLEQACRSLAEAHDKGMVHRDIKPANLYVCRRADEVDVVKVLDFGLVKHRVEGDQEATQLTEANALSGTPGFMAPEMALGLPVDGRADLYALACTAWFLLTGRTVYARETALATIVAHAHDSPGPLEAAEPVPPSLEAVIRHCLEKAPEARPKNAKALQSALVATGLAEQWTRARAESWWQAIDERRPVASAVATANTESLMVAPTLDG